MQVQPVPVPVPSLIAGSLPQVDFADAYHAALPLGVPRQPEVLVRAIFSSAPAWIGRLLRLRNLLVRPFGLRADSSEARASPTGPLRPGEYVGPFRVFTLAPDEVLMGLDDRHLDFRVSVLVRDEAVTVTTIVQQHNTFGRFYFAVVKPFHRVIVPVLIRQGLRGLARAATPVQEVV